MFLYEQAGSTGAAAHVYLKDGSIIHYDEAQTKAVITKRWVDPRVRDNMATAIEILMSSDQGTLEVDAQTWARSLFGSIQTTVTPSTAAPSGEPTAGSPGPTDRCSRSTKRRVTSSGATR